MTDVALNVGILEKLRVSRSSFSKMRDQNCKMRDALQSIFELAMIFQDNALDPDYYNYERLSVLAQRALRGGE